MKHDIIKERRIAFQIARETLNNLDITFTDEEILSTCRERQIRQKQLAVAIVLIGEGYGHNKLGRVLNRNQSVFGRMKKTVIRTKDEKLLNLIALTKLNKN
jgi:hypothetical protein